MYILIPMDSDDIEEASIVAINDVVVWTQLHVEEGRIRAVSHNANRDAFLNLSEVAVVKNDNEYVWPFMEQNMMVLVAHTQRSVDDIVEAYLFKELNELAY
ncbi:hypothetical protein Suden_1937 [Sulfurimonas denitrificans DSM 1251]|uniref:Uncharacterized protein n=1 Tax=Sulfurimonas denitrificans (strain ATCC 33889 / DSM 1251) TaxID=326298 RepID=Q30P70_SULDN|nr:hypothetical protein [Sulfurimonas denitrificans]ABB45211.1 hypothetical protein Suden_1937 [Sulfurimonas denitrificans DSM 1251]MDD3443555.1 hypothetical protein [Sulfurimonas denitrificans]